MRWLGRASVFVALLTLGFACSDSREKTAAELAAEANAKLLCDRLFDCCTPPELDALPFVDETKPPTLEGCTAYHAKTAVGYLPLTDSEAAAGRLAVHVDRSAACIEKLRAETCSEFHGRLPRLHVGDAYALCNFEVVEPLVENDGTCRLYLGCKGGSCVLPDGADHADAGPEAQGTCKDLPKAGTQCAADGCAEGFYCDPETVLCQKYLEAGENCPDDNACASGACRGGKCVSPGLCGG